MKVLLDENLPHQVRLEIGGHDVFTTAFMGWAGIENGELLKVAAASGFDVLITTDRGMEYEQNSNTLFARSDRIAGQAEHDRSNSPAL